MLTVVSPTFAAYLHDKPEKEGSLHIEEIELEEKLKEFRGTERFYSLFSVDPKLRRQEYTVGGYTTKGYRGPHKCTLDFIVFDFDCSKDIPKAHKDLKDLAAAIDAPHAIYFSGSKGYHLYTHISALGPDFEQDQYPAPALKWIAENLKKKYKTIDDTIYDVVRKIRAPGSLHPKSGKLKTPETFTPIERGESKLLSSLYQEYLASKTQSVESGIDADDDNEFIKDLKKLTHKACISKMLNTQYGEGSRHKALLIIVSDLFHQGMKGSEIRETVREWMLKNGMAGRDGELYSAIRQLETGASYMFGCKEPLRADSCSARCPLFPRLGASTLAARPSLPEDANESQKEKAATKTIQIRIKLAVAKLLVLRNIVFHAEQQEFYEFKSTHYLKVPQGELAAHFEANYMDIASNTNVNEFLGSLERRVSRGAEYFAQAALTHINFQNGHFNKATGLLEPRDHSRAFLYCLDFDYAEKAETPNWNHFLAQTFHNEATGKVDQGLVDVTLEYMGYTLTGDTQWVHKVYCAIGDGANGKSVLFSVMRSMMSKGAVSALTLQHLQKLESRPRLESVLANINSEESAKSLVNGTDVLKLLTTGDDVEARNLFARPYSFNSIAKLWIACNNLPDNYDQSHGLYRRLLVVPFKNMADEDPASAFNPTGIVYKSDPFIGDKLKLERAGIFNLAWNAYQAAKKRGKLTSSDTIKAALAEYKEDSDLVGTLIDEIFEQGAATDKMQVEEIVSAFKNKAFAYGRQLDTVYAKTVTASIKRKFKVIPTRIGALSARGYSGIKLRVVAGKDPGSGRTHAI